MTREIDALYADSPILSHDALEFEMVAQTPAQRKAAERQRRAGAGLARIEVYAHPDDRKAIKALASKLQAKREKQNRT